MGTEERNNVVSKEEEYPFPLTDVDRHNLSITDAEFKPHTWAELKQVIGAEAKKGQRISTNFEQPTTNSNLSADGHRI